MADEVDLDAVAFEQEVEVGERRAAVRDEDRGARERDGEQRRVALPVPTREPVGQPPGLASKVAAVHACLNVVWRAGSCLGSEVTIFWMLAWPEAWRP